jgi:hypothetical protein
MDEKKIIITEYIEANCPYCRFVEISILRDMIARRDEINKRLIKRGRLPLPVIELKLIDVDANDGNKEMQWFNHYSQKIGGKYTPAIRIGGSEKVFYLWGKQEKKDVPTKEQLSSSNKLKLDIIEEIQTILTKLDRDPLLYDKDLYVHKRRLYDAPVQVRYMPFGGI